jgi:hypothetical protein
MKLGHLQPIVNIHVRSINIYARIMWHTWKVKLLDEAWLIAIDTYGYQASKKPGLKRKTKL